MSKSPEKIPARLLERWRFLGQQKKEAAVIRIQDRRRARHEETARRLAAARKPNGIRMRWECRVWLPPHYRNLPGQIVIRMVPEVVDAWELVRDVERFIGAWRPMRLRTEGQRIEAHRAWDIWQRLGPAPF